MSLLTTAVHYKGDCDTKEVNNLGFSTNDRMVRVDFFKESRKWYTTEEMECDRYHSKVEGELELIHDTFKRCLDKAFGRNSFEGMMAVCLEPDHECAYPLMVRR